MSKILFAFGKLTLTQDQLITVFKSVLDLAIKSGDKKERNDSQFARFDSEIKNIDSLIASTGCPINRIDSEILSNWYNPAKAKLELLAK